MMKSAEIVLLIMVPIIVIASTKIKRTKSKNCSRKSMSAQTVAKKICKKIDIKTTQFLIDPDLTF